MFHLDLAVFELDCIRLSLHHSIGTRRKRHRHSMSSSTDAPLPSCMMIGSCLFIAKVHEYNSTRASSRVDDPIAFAKLLRLLHFQQAVFAKVLVRAELGNFHPPSLDLLRHVGLLFEEGLVLKQRFNYLACTSLDDKPIQRLASLLYNHVTTTKALGDEHIRNPFELYRPQFGEKADFPKDFHRIRLPL